MNIPPESKHMDSSSQRSSQDDMEEDEDTVMAHESRSQKRSQDSMQEEGEEEEAGSSCCRGKRTREDFEMSSSSRSTTARVKTLKLLALECIESTLKDQVQVDRQAFKTLLAEEEDFNKSFVFVTYFLVERQVSDFYEEKLEQRLWNLWANIMVSVDPEPADSSHGYRMSGLARTFWGSAGHRLREKYGIDDARDSTNVKNEKNRLIAFPARSMVEHYTCLHKRMAAACEMLLTRAVFPSRHQQRSVLNHLFSLVVLIYNETIKPLYEKDPNDVKMLINAACVFPS